MQKKQEGAEQLRHSPYYKTLPSKWFWSCYLEGDLWCFFVFFLPFPCCACKISGKLKRSKSAPTEAPVSHRKHCSWNAHQWPCLYFHDITLSHYVTHLCRFCRLVWYLRSDLAAVLLLWVVLAQACVSWPIRAEWVFRRAPLKRRELKQSTGQYQATGVFSEHYSL